MKNLILLAGLLCLTSGIVYGQNSVGIGTESPNPNAVLELVSPTKDQGLLVPRLTTAERTAPTFISKLSDTDQALLVFDLDEMAFFFWTGSEWKQVGNTFLSGSGINISEEGLIENKGDLDSLNEIQDLELVGNSLSVTKNESASAIDLSPFLDNTDDQAAGDVAVTTQNGISSTNVQAALEELQSEIPAHLSALTNDAGFITSPNDSDADPANELQSLTFSSGQLTLSSDPNSTIVDLSTYDTNGSDDFSGDYADLVNAPDFTGWDTDAGDDFDGDFNSLTNIPADLADGDADTQLDEATVDSYVANNGFLTAEVDGDVANELQSLTFSSGQLTLSSDPSNTIVDLSAYDANGSDDFSGDYVDLVNAPDFTGWDVNAADDFDGDFGSLINVPAGLADGDNDTDDQTAAEVNIAAITGVTATTVQGALSEHQTDINGITTNVSNLQNSVTTLEQEKMEYYLVPASDFSSVPDSKDGTSQRDLLKLVYGTNGIPLYLQASDIGFTAKLSAPLRLSNGSTVQSFDVRMKSTLQIPSVLSLYQLSLTDGVATELANATLEAGQSSTVLSVEKTVLIDNRNYLYYFLFQGEAATGTNGASLHYVQVAYSYTLNSVNK